MTSRRTVRFSAHSNHPELPLEFVPPLPSGADLAAVDLFAGIGGLSIGFKELGFAVTGVDHEPVAKVMFESAELGTAETWDLGKEMFVKSVPLVLGGPPCTPWSAVNLQRRRERHDDHVLLERFFANTLEIGPEIVVMENVPALGSDSSYADGVNRLRREGYHVVSRILKYHDFGAATRRRRLFTVGIRSSRVGGRVFFKRLETRVARARTVRQEIGWLRNQGRDSVPDHDWSELRSIGNYSHLYKSGKFGWTKLAYDEAAPSFGSVAKTYILHPEAGEGGFPERVLSVREVLAITGFDLKVAFPVGTPRAKRYRMAANAVSPHVSRAVASVVREFLVGTETDPPVGSTVAVGP
jgi:DNA (cytosine-5)-methyltransferase 1